MLSRPSEDYVDMHKADKTQAKHTGALEEFLVGALLQPLFRALMRAFHGALVSANPPQMAGAASRASRAATSAAAAPRAGP